MKNRIILDFAAIFVFGILFTVPSFAQKMNDSSMNHKTMHMKEDKQTVKNNPIVREGIIDLQAIDKNQDGKVYQDVMDFNVISDKPGKCPLCGMTLNEVSLKQAKETLLKNGFKVKK